MKNYRYSYCIIKTILLGLWICTEAKAQRIAYRPETAAAPAHQLESGLSPSAACYSHILHQRHLENSANAALRMERANQSIRNFSSNGAREILTVPVVVHFVEPDYYTPYNTSTAQVAVDHLNNAFGNSSEYYFFGGSNVDIRFCLAAQDPEGNETVGFTTNVSPYSYVNVDNDDQYLKNTVRWNTEHYINIWVVNEIYSTNMGNGVAGYAYLPEAHGSDIDGIVVEYQFFGNNVDNDKVLIHEMGHYFGLYHTFEGGCTNNDCTVDNDRVCDTPPDGSTDPSDCFSLPNTCASDTDDASANNPFRAVNLGGLGEQPDMLENYMDYGFLMCQHRFSQGQSERMYAALTQARTSLLESLGCVELCPWVTDISILGPDTVFVNESFTLSGIANDAFNHAWFLDGDSISNEIAVNLVFEEPGVHSIRFKTRYFGNSCFRVADLQLIVECDAQASFSANASEFSLEETVVLSNTSSGASNYQWILDGAPNAVEEDWSKTFYKPGQHFVFLLASSAVCTDTSRTFFFKVGDCRYSKATTNWTNVNTIVMQGENGPITNPFRQFWGNEWLECSSAMSTHDGVLLFATNGEQIVDAATQVMPNGDDLLGHASANMGCIIVPSPANNNQYYVFYSDAIENSIANGLRYSVVDMTLNNGLGDVIPETKNTLLRLNLSERIVATFHDNDRDVWLVAHDASGTKHYAFLIDGNGVHHNPVISDNGSQSDVGLGGMAFSHDGHRLATFNPGGWPWMLDLAYFNKTTGEITTTHKIPLSVLENEQIFSIEFSPDNSKLYCTHMLGGKMKAYDLTGTTIRSVQESKTVLRPNWTFHSQLKCAPNGKIYLNDIGRQYLEVIENPNDALQNVEVTSNHTELPLGIGASAALMNCVEGYDSPKHPQIAGPASICADGTSREYSTLFTKETDQITWSHSGNSSVLLIGSNLHLTNSTETAIDTLTIHVIGDCGIYDDTLVVHSNHPIYEPSTEFVTLCANEATLQVYEQVVRQTWSNGSNQGSIVVTSPGTYTVEQLEISGCTVLTTFQVSNSQVEPFSLGPDLQFCTGQVITLGIEGEQQYDQFLWNTGSSMDQMATAVGGTYWLQATDSCGMMYTDSLNLTEYIAQFSLTYNGSENVCDTQLPVTLELPVGYSEAIWNGLPGQNSFVVTEPTEVHVRAKNEDGCYVEDLLLIDDCSSILETAHNTTTTLYPNPASSEAMLWNKNSPITCIRVFDHKGALIHTQMPNAQHFVRLGILHFSAGIYTIEITTEHNCEYLKMMVEK